VRVSLAADAPHSASAPHDTSLSSLQFSGMGAARAEDAQGISTQSHISPSLLVYKDETIVLEKPLCESTHNDSHFSPAACECRWRRTRPTPPARPMPLPMRASSHMTKQSSSPGSNSDLVPENSFLVPENYQKRAVHSRYQPAGCGCRWRRTRPTPPARPTPRYCRVSSCVTNRSS